MRNTKYKIKMIKELKRKQWKSGETTWMKEYKYKIQQYNSKRKEKIIIIIKKENK